MTKALLKIGLLTLTQLAAVTVHAGIRDSGGGLGVVCTEGSETKVYLAHVLAEARAGQLRDIENVSPESLLQIAVAVLEKSQPEKAYPHPLKAGEKVSLGWLVEHTRANLEFRLVQELPQLDDDHLDPKSLPAGCRKAQIAVQLVGQNIVYKHLHLDREMTMLERGLLEVHETFVAIRHQPGEDTTPIRQKLSSLMNDGTFTRALLAVARADKARQSFVPRATWAGEFKSRYCKASTYITRFSDLLWLGACNVVEDFPAYEATPARYKLPVTKDQQLSPTVTRCKVTSGDRQDKFLMVGDEFTIVRQNEATDPTYAIQFDTGQTLVSPSGEGFSKNAFGWQSGRESVSVVLNHHARLNEFIGNFQRWDGSRWETHKVSCQ